MNKSVRILHFVLYFISSFTLIAFCLTSNFFLFLFLLKRDAEIIFTESNIHHAALYTFWNAVFLGILFALFNIIKRKITVENPTKKIIEATDKITNGDLTTRIKPVSFPSTMNEYNKIIHNLNKMTEELSGTETLKTDFISSVSHELKTPLSVLHNYGTLLEQPELSEEKRMEYAKTIVNASTHLSNLITNILKLNKLENKKIYPEKQKFSLSEQICEIIFAYENIFEKKNLDISADIQEDVYVLSDPELLRVVWSNLISNAVKFTDKGHIGITLKSDNTKTTVTISDTGCGMDSKTIKHIFEKFYQGDNSHSSNGNGLGLSIAKKILDIFGGEIFVESEIGKGSIFTVIILN